MSELSVREAGALQDERGSALIEMALALPVFFMFTFGFISFALVMFGLCNITYASRSVSRYACLHSDHSYVPATMATMNGMILPYIFRYPSNLYTTSVSYGGAGGGNVVGNTATVSITVTYTLSVPFYTYRGLKISSSTVGVIIQ